MILNNLGDFAMYINGKNVNKGIRYGIKTYN
jgi:hypothetical protein